MNGVWDRLIRRVRKIMEAILGSQNALTGLEALRTVFAEVVSILNSRPLTPSSDDPSDPEPLTLNHILLQRKHLALQRKHLALPPGLLVHEDLYRRIQWRRAPFPSWLLLEEVDQRVRPNVTTAPKMCARERKFKGERPRSDRLLKVSSWKMAPWPNYEDLSRWWPMCSSSRSQDEEFNDCQTNIETCIAGRRNLAFIYCQYFVVSCSKCLKERASFVLKKFKNLKWLINWLYLSLNVGNSAKPPRMLQFISFQLLLIINT